MYTKDIWNKFDEQETEGGKALLCYDKEMDNTVCSIKCAQTRDGERAVIFYDFTVKQDTILLGKEYNGFDVRCNPASNEITIIVSDREYNSIFSAFVECLVETIRTLTNSAGIEPAIIGYLDTWAAFMKDVSKHPLGPKEIRGLYGELYFLLNVLIPEIGVEHAVTAWHGSEKYPQDFIVGKTGIEVKTSVDKEGQKIHISNEPQLNNSGFSNLYLRYFRLTRTGEGKDTLPDLVAQITECCSSDKKSYVVFREKLTRAGYLDEHEDTYRKTGISIIPEQSRYYKVTDDFPCLTRVKYMKDYIWIADVSYSINIACLESFTVPEKDVISSIKGEL